MGDGLYNRLTTPGENEDRVCRYDYFRRGREPIEPMAARLDSSPVPSDVRIHPVVEHVAVEHLEPVACRREWDPVATERRLVKTRDDDEVAADAFDPSLKREHGVEMFPQHGAHGFAGAC